ncbi:MAG: class I SAM-dependent methyltransferase [Chitinophagaceae bacterium]|nr:MAG: class I SAM-dependent methyltransferase [Chitinophagaceae bacterium]
MAIRDHSVTGETFQLWECRDCTLRFTQDVPDTSSIGRYYQSAAYISHTNTRAGFINKLYHIVRNRTLGQKKKLICGSTGLQTGKLLDIGAGAGAFAAYMKNAGWQVTALEPDASTRKKALEEYRLNMLPAESLFELDSAQFDAITLWHVLEHVHDLHGYLAQLKKLLKPSGFIYIAVPNYTSYDAAKYAADWAAYDMPIHLYHFSPKAMNKLLGIHQLRLKEMRPMWFDSFYVSLLSEKYRTGKQQLLKGFMSGLVSNVKASTDKSRCSSLIYVVRP